MGTETTRDKLKATFAALRKQGFIARANFMCCSGCAGYAIAEQVSKMTAEQAATIKGCVFWHRQDDEGLRDGDGVYLAFGQVRCSTYGDVGLPSEEVGKAIVMELVKHDMRVAWDGSAGQRIFVAKEAAQ